eukprot:sb/3473437/
MCAAQFSEDDEWYRAVITAVSGVPTSPTSLHTPLTHPPAPLPPLTTQIPPQVGEMCAAQFSEDDEWYRAVITAVSGDQVQVQYIDYGNEENKRASEVRGYEIVILKLEEVFELADSLKGLPAQASLVQLNGIAIPPENWGDVAHELNAITG